MKIESIFTGMPVYHKDGGPNMTVQRCLATGHVLCECIELDGRKVEQIFWPAGLELGTQKICDFLLTGL